MCRHWDEPTRQNVRNVSVEFEDSCVVRDDLRKAYEKCNDISQESRALICTLLKESSEKDRKLHLSMYGKAAQLEKQMDAKSAWFQEKYSGRTHRGISCSSSQTNCPLTEKELHQLRMDEEALKEMLEEEAMNKKAREERIRQEQAENDAFFLEFGVESNNVDDINIPYQLSEICDDFAKIMLEINSMKMASLESIRILLADAYALDFKLYQMDVKSESVDNTKYRGMIGLWYPMGSGIETIVYAASNHAGDYVDRKSTSGVCTFMGCCLTSWFSKKQTALAISTTEAEYVSTGKACQHAIWMKQALVEYGVRLDDIPIMCNNKGAIDLSKNPIQHSRTKHIEIRHHFLRDNVQKRNISIEKVSSEDNIADILTKPLKHELFNYLRLCLGMMEQID
ncbi:hypothetical protein Tco_0133246 [Tanacetum coccineum]